MYVENTFQTTIPEKKNLSFALSGCNPCNCDYGGSTSLICDKGETGQCPCRRNLVGRECREYVFLNNFRMEKMNKKAKNLTINICLVK